MWSLSNPSRVFSRVSNCGTDGETAIALFCRAHPFVKDPTQMLLQIKSEKAAPAESRCHHSGRAPRNPETDRGEAMYFASTYFTTMDGEYSSPTWIEPP